MKKYLPMLALAGVILVSGCNCKYEDKILFDTDSYKLTVEDKAELDKVAATLKSSKARNVKIYGHADATGTAQHNMMLSKERAIAAASYLEAKGVRHDRITLGAYGDTEPVATNKTKEGRKENRRVELVYY